MLDNAQLDIHYSECHRMAYEDLTDDEVKSLSVQFIRGQDEISIYEGEGTDIILKAWEVYKKYSKNVFVEILEYGSCVLASGDEPAKTLRTRRIELGIDRETLAKELSLKTEDIEKIESGKYDFEIRTINQLCQKMELDDYLISSKKMQKNAGLAYRLKEVRSDNEIKDSDILALAECGWIADKQILLQSWLNEYNPISTKKSNNYGDFRYPAYRVGYDLANTTRRILNISPSSPIKSMRDLFNKLSIPYVTMPLSKHIAGATVATESSRCIVANTVGQNTNPLVRRLTVAHELGHLLWDPDKNLKSLIVDSYDDFEESYFEDNADRYIEQRANAFAIELLMPAASVKKRNNTESIQEYIRANMLQYGTSFTSTKFHLFCNDFITDHEMKSLNDPENFVKTTPSDEWKGEEDHTLDYFPLTVQENKKGIFSYWVAKSFSEGLISLDSAAGFLGCTTSNFKNAYQTIISLFTDGE